MRPDLDDFEEMNQDAEAAPRSRAMSWLVLGVAVTGFAALAYYAYQSGTHSLGDSNILEVAADEGAIKTAPANPGGEEFPHQDKTIYDALTGDEQNQKVEKLLPEPEQAVIPEPAVGEDTAGKGKTTTFVNQDVADKADESAPAPAPVAKPAAAPAPVATPEPAATAPAVAPTPEIRKEAAKEIAKPEPKAAASSGDYKIQLGAFSSEAEARTNWNRISKKFADTVKGEPIIVKADLPNGTFYRLRASGFASAAETKAACAKLSAAKQPCFPVK